MTETITKPSFPPPTLPDTHYKYLATIGIDRARLENTCVDLVYIRGISNIELNTVKAEYDSVVYHDIPVWIHTDYGTRRRLLRGEEAADPADYFERAALMFPLGGTAMALVETVGETKTVLGIISVRSSVNTDFFGDPRPMLPRYGGWPTYKLYLDIKIYCNDWKHKSKYEFPDKERSSHRVIYDMHTGSTALILNAGENGFVPAECSFVNDDEPTSVELDQEAVIDLFLGRGRPLNWTGSTDSQLETVYEQDTDDIYKRDPCTTGGVHFDLDGVQYDYGWIEVGDDSWEIDPRIQPPFSPGTAVTVRDDTYNQIVTSAYSMAGYDGGVKSGGGSRLETIGRGYDIGEYWCIMSYDGSFESRTSWMTVPFDMTTPVPDGDPDKKPAAYQPNMFCERRRYAVGGDSEIIFDSFNSDVDYLLENTLELDGEGVPTGSISEQSAHYSAYWNFKITLKVDGSPDVVLHDFSYEVNEHSLSVSSNPDRPEADITLANMSPLYVANVTRDNYIHNTMFYSHGIGIATINDDMGVDEASRDITVLSKDNDIAYGIIDVKPENSALPTPSLDLSLIINQFKTKLAANTDEGWWVFPEGDNYAFRKSYQAGHMHITCQSWLVPYNLKDALVG